MGLLVMKINAEREILKRAEKVSLSNIRGLLGKEHVASMLVAKSSALLECCEDVKTSFDLIRVVYNGQYKELPLRLLFSIAGALIYLVSPLDVIPDWIPIAGLLDDATVLQFAFECVRPDLDAYKRWRTDNNYQKR